jgi:hypothetical protein
MLFLIHFYGVAALTVARWQAWHPSLGMGP